VSPKRNLENSYVQSEHLFQSVRQNAYNLTPETQTNGWKQMREISKDEIDALKADH
jgi:RecA-family ATPase